MPKRLSKFKKWILFDYALLSLFVSGVTAPLLIALLLGGALLSLIIFALVWKNYLVRTWLPLFSFMGFILPLLIRYDENILKLLVIGYFLVILSSSFSVAALRQW